MGIVVGLRAHPYQRGHERVVPDSPSGMPQVLHPALVHRLQPAIRHRVHEEFQVEKLISFITVCTTMSNVWAQVG